MKVEFGQPETLDKERYRCVSKAIHSEAKHYPCGIGRPMHEPFAWKKTPEDLRVRTEMGGRM